MTLALLAAGLSGAAAACAPPGPFLQGDGLAPGGVAAEVHADYELFARRCSKCHALSRALNSGIDDDEFWRRYVDRMRRQPASGISREDEVPILRFLHHYSIQVKRARASGGKGLFPLPGVPTPPPLPPAQVQ